MEQGKQPVKLTKEQIIGVVIKNLGEIKVPISLHDEVSVPIINGITNLFTVLELCSMENEKMQELFAENEALKARLAEVEPVKANDTPDAYKDQVKMDLDSTSADPYPENLEDTSEENQNGTEYSN